MNLDLNSFTADWRPERDTVASRKVIGPDGIAFIQLRVDLGLLQMFAEGRPDGARFHGLPSALDYIRHELRLGHPVGESDWADLERELHQFNYRRLAYGGLAEDALSRGDRVAAVDLLHRTVDDVEHCLALIQLMEREAEGGAGQHTAQVPVLLFNQARLRARALTLEERFEEAIDAADAGIVALDEALGQAGFDDAQRENDPGIAYLRQTIHRLREQNGIGQTLAERLADAVAREDFATAARIRDELRRRGEKPHEA